MPCLFAAACLDPMLGLYARFYMSDLLAGLLFVAFLACICCALKRFMGHLLPVVARGAGMPHRRRLRPRRLPADRDADHRHRRALDPAISTQPPGKMAVLSIVPLVSAGMLAGANMAVFAGRFPGELFLNKSAGIFLFGAFAPAITAADFRAAGVPALDTEIQALDLQNYDKRGTQIWGTDDHSAQGADPSPPRLDGSYPPELDSVSKSIVWHAFLRDPLAIATVYAKSLLFYVQPSQWRRFLKHELGLTRLLPQETVDDLNLSRLRRSWRRSRKNPRSCSMRSGPRQRSIPCSFSSVRPAPAGNSLARTRRSAVCSRVQPSSPCWPAHRCTRFT